MNLTQASGRRLSIESSTKTRGTPGPFGTTRMVALALGLVLATVTTAPAIDLCLSIPNFFGTNTLVGKKFRVPPRNQCKSFHGFTQAPPFVLVAGTGCTSANGFSFYLHFTTHSASTGEDLIASCSFNASTMNGGCSSTVTIPSLSDNELFPETSSASGQPCTVNVP